MTDPNVLHNLSYGMYIVSSYNSDKLNGQIANTVFQITSEPVTIAVSINKKNLTHELIETSGVFTVSVLGEDAPLEFIGRFGFRTGRKEDKFSGISFKTLESGCPVVLEHSICYAAAEVTGRLDCLTHTLFLGKMTGSEMLKQANPMTYAFYHMVKHGSTPRSAPTFIKGEK